MRITFPFNHFSTQWRIWYSFVMLAVLYGGCKNQDTSVSKDYGTILMQIIDRAVQNDPLVQNAVLLVESPKLSLRWKGASGLADPIAGTATKPNQPFHWASIGKFTLSALVLKLK